MDISNLQLINIKVVHMQQRFNTVDVIGSEHLKVKRRRLLENRANEFRPFKRAVDLFQKDGNLI